MVPEGDFREYVRDLKEVLSESFEERFFFSPASDIAAARELFRMGVKPQEVLLILEHESPPGRFSLFHVKELIKSRAGMGSSCEVEETSGTGPYARVEAIYSHVRSLLSRLGIDGRELLNRIERLLEVEEPLEIERELIKIEDELLKLLEEKSPASGRCRENVERRLERYSFYWSDRILRLTRKELLRECLRKEYGLPEFTSLDSP